MPISFIQCVLLCYNNVIIINIICNMFIKIKRMKRLKLAHSNENRNQFTHKKSQK